MEQPDLFTGEQLRDFGIKAAERDRTLVIQAVDKAIEALAATRMAHEGDARPVGFTADHVRGFLGRYVRDLDDVSAVIGARIRAAAVRGDIFSLGESVVSHRPSAHSRRMLLWYGKGEV